VRARRGGRALPGGEVGGQVLLLAVVCALVRGQFTPYLSQLESLLRFLMASLYEDLDRSAVADSGTPPRVRKDGPGTAIGGLLPQAIV